MSGVESLTPRERQVAKLAADGLSNREISELLFVTIKTVEWHLKHTYKKLEVRSRAELAPLLARRVDPKTTRDEERIGRIPVKVHDISSRA